MARPFCSSGEPWDFQSDSRHAGDFCKVFRDNENGDVILFTKYSENLVTEQRMSSDFALRYALTIMKTALKWSDEGAEYVYSHLKGS